MTTDGAQVDVAATVRLVERVLTSAGLDVERVGASRVMTMLAGEHKRTIPLLVDVGNRTLALSSLFIGVPDEGHAEVHALLLHRNQRLRHIHFALDDAGQVVIVGRIPIAAIDEELLGEVLGEVLTTADEAFNAVLRRGFASYIEHEQAWRSKAGLPPNPVGSDADGQEA